jgi:nicotinic acid mononucleotide adenylyltransferase
VQPITAHAIDASSIRAELARGAEGVAAVRGLLPAAVLAYIDRNQLYRSRPDAT